MLALFRILIIIAAFLLINATVLVVCVVRPFHRNNVYFSGQAYGLISKLLGVKVNIVSHPDIENNLPYVFIANHQNTYDIFTVCKAAKKGVVTIGKKSLKWIPIFGQIYALSGNIMIDRSNSSQAKVTLEKAARRIREKNLSVWVFPEGTRSYGRGLLPFKTGAFRLALQTQEPVVMVCVSNTHNKIRLNRWDNGTITIKLCSPQIIDNTKTARQWADYFHAQMQREIAMISKTI